MRSRIKKNSFGSAQGFPQGVGSHGYVSPSATACSKRRVSDDTKDKDTLKSVDTETKYLKIFRGMLAEQLRQVATQKADCENVGLGIENDPQSDSV